LIEIKRHSLPCAQLGDPLVHKAIQQASQIDTNQDFSAYCPKQREPVSWFESSGLQAIPQILAETRQQSGTEVGVLMESIIRRLISIKGS